MTEAAAARAYCEALFIFGGRQEAIMVRFLVFFFAWLILAAWRPAVGADIFAY